MEKTMVADGETRSAAPTEIIGKRPRDKVWRLIFGGQGARIRP
jgi:hypothetical protein